VDVVGAWWRYGTRQRARGEERTGSTMPAEREGARKNTERRVAHAHCRAV